jgi:ubiquinone/menaquinone biosynthesis C-methylase UbiE
MHDPTVVREEYADETRLAARKAAYAGAEGPDARDVLFEAIAEGRPGRILEVGPGEGELAERLQRELGADVVAVDQSARMVELTRSRSVDARLGSVEQLEFDDESFDCVVAAWMLYHVQDLDRAFAEIVRVLRPGGRLVAVTNGFDHLKELYELVGRQRLRSSFLAEDAEQILPRFFARVERRDAHGWVVFPDAETAQSYVGSLVLLRGARVPPVEGPIRVRRRPSIFVAERA